MTLVYGRLVAEGVDPVEKKPLYHFLPGSTTYSIATAGCNLRCAHCQNYAISQFEGKNAPLPGTHLPPGEAAAHALASGAASVSYTYTEPTIFFEYAKDVMTLAHEQGLKNVFVTNGFFTREALELATGLLDAANVDLKAMDDAFYRDVCGARLEPVLDSIRELVARKIWVEVTTLVIPGRNDAEAELRRAARFLADLDPDLPWHVTGFYPTYRLTDAPPTPAALLEKVRTWGLEEGLRHVYTGNRPDALGQHTYCPGCGQRLLERRGFTLSRRRIDAAGRCEACGRALAGVFGETRP